MSLPELICIDPKRIDEFWPHAKTQVRTAIEHTNLSSFEDIERDVLDGKMLLWLAWSGEIEAVAVTQLLPGVLVIVACSGHHRERWLPLFTRIEQYAKDEQCKSVRIYGRKGWERVLDGYRVEHVVLEKQIGRHLY